jgi:carboxyl-terminal processing protease
MEIVMKRWAFVCGIAAMLAAQLGQAQEAPLAQETANVKAAAETATPEVPQDEYYDLMRVFVDTFEQVDRNYVKDVDRRELVEAAVRGMLSKLDPYSDYISPDDLSHFTEAVEQEFGGIGIQVHWDPEKRELQVMTPLPGSPAYAAGIHAGDLIVEIEGKPVIEFPKDKELQTAVQMLKGEPGVSVNIGIKHPESDEIQKITLKRAIIQLDTVLGDLRNEDQTWNFMLDDEKKIGYLRLTHFTRRSSEEMRTALQKLKEQGMKALILDLRLNPGGLLQSAVEISDMFIDEGVIVSTEGRNSRERSWYAKKFGTYSGFPMAVLVNRLSASASEILSACLQDHKRAVVIGERTWGKGSVQNVIELSGGDSALKLTTASYHRPSGKNIHRFPGAKEDEEWGVKPNEGYEVPLPVPLEEYQRYRIARDLRRPDGMKEFVDPQLQKAVEYLTGQLTAAPPEPGKAEAPAGEAPKEAADAQKAKDAAQLSVPLAIDQRHQAG